MTSLLRTGLVLLLATLVSACSSPDDPAEILADYNARIARVLDVPLPARGATRVPTWPASRDIVLAPADVRIGVFAFLDFRRCGLLREISERNSVLGRVQTPSQRLLYEMRLLRGLRQCAASIDRDAGTLDAETARFADTVDLVYGVKQRDLPVVYWNATFGAPELREFFSVNVVPLRAGQAALNGNPANALAWLAALGRLAPDAPLPAGEAMEQQYFQLVGNKLGGRTWLSLDLAIRELDRSSQLVEQAAAARTLCPGGRPGRRAERLRNVFTTVYVQRVQPWLVTTAREGWVLSDALERLWQAQQVPPTHAMTNYRASVWVDQPGSLLHDYDASVRRHALAWKSLLAPCGLAPGDPSPHSPR